MSIVKYIDDNALIEMMEQVRDICSTLNSIRTKNNIRNRQPLASATIDDPDQKFSYLCFEPEFVNIIKDECNIKDLYLQQNNIKYTL